MQAITETLFDTVYLTAVITPPRHTYLFGILNLDFSRLFSFPFFKIPPFVYCASSM